jgi:hypothetical protein
MAYTSEEIVDAVDRSVIETIEAFIRFRPGFHGDTGIRDYLYHRLMMNLPDSGLHLRPDGDGTLLAQAEWYTTLKYRNKGKASSPGKFDLGIPKPTELDRLKPGALVAFECGRNKKADVLLRDIDAPIDHEGPRSADISKLIREICHKQLPYGYSLQFFDKGGDSDALQLVNRLKERADAPGFERLRAVVLLCATGDKPYLKFLSLSWDQSVRSRFHNEIAQIENLISSAKYPLEPPNRGARKGHSGRVSKETFLSFCSDEARALIQEIGNRLGSDLNLHYGPKTMTVNCRPAGKLMKITPELNCIQDLDSALEHRLHEILQRPVRRLERQIEGTSAYRDAVISALAHALGR